MVVTRVYSYTVTLIVEWGGNLYRVEEDKDGRVLEAMWALADTDATDMPIWTEQWAGTAQALGGVGQGTLTMIRSLVHALAKQVEER